MVNVVAAAAVTTTRSATEPDPIHVAPPPMGFPRLRHFALTGILFTTLRLTSAAADPAWHTFHHEHVLGTSLELRFAASQAGDAQRAEAAALAEIDRLAAVLSGYDANSEFSHWAATRGEPRRVSADLLHVLALFDTWRDRTRGALDAAAETTVRLWRGAASEGRAPSPAEIDAVVAAVAARHWELDPAAGTATRLSDAALRLNSFAKGYIIDRAATAALGAAPIEGVVVNLGGDVLARGSRSVAVAVTDPVADAETDAPLTSITVLDRAVATSGGYRRGVSINGRWYSHLVDPRTGRPVDHVRSATVTAADAVEAGALATALCVLPPAEGLTLVASRAGAECLIITSDGESVVSPGWTGTDGPQPAPPRPDLHAAPTTAAAAPGGNKAGVWDSNYEVVVDLEIARPAGGRAKRPFVAVWIEDQDHFPIRTLALWYHGDRWLPDLRSWYRGDQLRSLAEGAPIVATVSSATRGPGRYTVRWDGRDNQGKPVPSGKYTIYIEAAREHGTHQLVSGDLVCNGSPAKLELPANVELSGVAVDYRARRAGR